MPKVATEPEVMAPSVRYTRRDEPTCPPHGPFYDEHGSCDRCCTRNGVPRLFKRQITVTNPDGSTTEHTYWSDTQMDRHIS